MGKKLSYILIGCRATGKTYFREYIITGNLQEYSEDLMKIMRIIEDAKLALESGIEPTDNEKREILRSIEEFSIKYKRKHLLNILSENTEFKRKINELYNIILKIYNDFFRSSKEITVINDRIGNYEIRIVDIPGEFIEDFREEYERKLKKAIKKLESSEVFIFITDLLLPNPKRDIYLDFSVREEIKIKNLKRVVDIIKSNLKKSSYYYIVSKFDKEAFYGIIPGFLKLVEETKDIVKNILTKEFKEYMIIEHENYDGLARLLFKKKYNIYPPENIIIEIDIDKNLEFLDKVSLKFLELIINYRLDYITTIIGRFPIKKSSVSQQKYSPWRIVLEDILENYEIRKIKNKKL